MVCGACWNSKDLEGCWKQEEIEEKNKKKTRAGDKKKAWNIRNSEKQNEEYEPGEK